jgi:hypothetical protein
MGMTRRKPRPLNRELAARDATLFVVATEDTYAPKQYLDLFHSTRVQVKVLETRDGCSSPQHVLERLIAFKEEFDLDESDQLWLAIDTDRWPVESLSSVASEANQKKFFLAVSNPCFDLWILLHFSELPASCAVPGVKCDAIGQAIRVILGRFNKANLDTALFTADKIHQAILRAKKLDQQPENRWPQSVGTRFYLLVVALQKFGVAPVEPAAPV